MSDLYAQYQAEAMKVGDQIIQWARPAESPESPMAVSRFGSDIFS